MSSDAEQDAETVIAYAVDALPTTKEDAERWYHNDVIPAFTMTAEKAVEAGHADAVIDYLKRISIGGYA